jgi:hypothetical protein
MNQIHFCFAVVALLLVGWPSVLVNGQGTLGNGLVSLYRFDGNANDMVGTNHGTVFGATLAPDMFGRPNRAYSFKGTNSWILCPDSKFPSGNSPRTISLWVQFRSYGVPIPRNPVFICYGSGQANDTFYAILMSATKPNNPIAVGQSGGGDTPLADGTKLNNWYHVAFTHDGTQTKLYIDGILRGTASRKYATVLDGKFYIGSYTHVFGWTASDPTHDGLIDNVRVYDRALPSEEVARLFAYESLAAPPLEIEVASVRLKWLSELGVNYQIQWSSKIQDWTLLKTFVGTGSEMEFVDETRGDKRFYRFLPQ